MVSKYRNRVWNLYFLALVGLLLWPTWSIPQVADQSVQVGYVSLTSVQQAKQQSDRDSFAPNLLVRFARTEVTTSVLAMTDMSGTAVVPLEPGRYCATAYGLDGKPAAMSPRSQEPLHRCLTVKAGSTIEFSVTVAAGVTYVKSIPSLGVS